MQNNNDNLFDMVAEICRPLPIMPLAAIWLNKPVVTANKFITKRIEEGDIVKIKNGELVDCLDKESATHVITMCRGRSNCDFSINVMDIHTQELSTVKL